MTDTPDDEFLEVIQVKQKEALPPSKRTIEKEIFINILEDDLLKDVSPFKQSLRSVQENIHKKALTVYNLYQEAERIKKEGDNPLLNFLNQNRFDKVPHIIPVVLDERPIYTLTCEKTYDEEGEEDKGDLQEGDVLENFTEQMKHLREIEKQWKNGDLNFISYLTAQHKEGVAYRLPENISIPHYRVRLSHYTPVLRYYNVGTAQRKARIAYGSLKIPLERPRKKTRVEIFDDVKKEMVAIPGEDLAIVGYLILPLATDTIPETIEHVVRVHSRSSLSDKDLDLTQPTLILWDQGSNGREVPSSLLRKINKRIVPKDEQVATLALSRATTPFTMDNVLEQLQRLGYHPHQINTQAWSMLRDAIQTSALSYQIAPEQPMLRTEESLCKITDPKNLLRDTEYRSPFMRKAYGTGLLYLEDSTYESRSPDCLLHRLNVMEKTLDQGDFYYIHSYLQQEPPPINLDDVQKTLLTLQRNLEKKTKSNKEVPNAVGEILYENTDKEASRLRDIFQKEMSIPEQVVEARKQLQRIETQLNLLSQTKQQSKERQTQLTQKMFQTAQQLVRLHLQGRSTISPAELAQILKEKEAQNKEKEATLFHSLVTVDPKLQSILRDIAKLPNEADRRASIFNIIKLDGGLIDNYIYSRLYQAPLFCGHWYYEMLYEEANTNQGRQLWLSELLTRFGDQGSAEKDRNSCIVCGNYLNNVALANPLYLMEDGLPLKLQEFSESVSRKPIYLHSLPAASIPESALILPSVRDCSSRAFLDELTTQGFKEDDLNRSKQICGILDSIIKKLDLSIALYQFVSLVTTCVKDAARSIPTFYVYAEQKKKEIQISERLSDNELKKLEEKPSFLEQLAKTYSVHITTRIGTLATAHLLWHLRTCIPSVRPGPKKLTDCSFFTFEGDQGLEYMLCLLLEMKILRARFTLRGTVVEQPVRRTDIAEHLRYWLRVLEKNYQPSIQLRKQYDEDVQLFEIRKGSRRTDRSKEMEIAWDKLPVQPLPEEKDVFSWWKKGNYSKYQTWLENYKLQSLHQSYLLKDKLNQVASTLVVIPTEDERTNNAEQTCCVHLAKEDVSITAYLEQKDETIKSSVEEVKKLSRLEEDVQKRYTTTRFVLQRQKKAIPRDFINTFNPKNLTHELIQDKFLYYCHDGPVPGERHEMENNLEPEKARCIKCSWFLRDLKKKEFTDQDYLALLHHIQERSINIYKPQSLPVFFLPLSSLSSLKKEAQKNLENDLKRLVDVLAHALPSRKEEVLTTYKPILKNMTNFDHFFPEPDQTLTNRQVILLRQKRDELAQEKMKVYINDILCKEVSRIQHGYKPIVREIAWLSQKEAEMFQKIILNRQEWIEPFINSTNQKIFSAFSFHYSYKDLQTIKGVSNLYDEDGNWIIRKSSFTPKDASLILHHYFITQTLLFFDLAGANATTFAEFLLNVLNLIEKDRAPHQISKRQLQKWKDTRREKSILQRMRYFEAITEDDALLFNAPYKKHTQDIWEDPEFKEKYGEFTFEETEEEKEGVRADRESHLVFQAKQVFGEDASEKQINSYVVEKEEEEEMDQEVEDDIYPDQPDRVEGPEVMEVGYDYGDMPQNIDDENADFDDAVQANLVNNVI